MITIIDYKSGNLKSISNGFKKIGVDYRITDDKEIIAGSDYLVLPGVGAFGSAMENLKPFEEIIHEHVGDDKPFLGICLGQQVLMSSSDESPGAKGLDLFKGHVELLPEGVKIPHMGWNTVNHTDHPLFSDIKQDAYFYFDHSFAMQTGDYTIGKTTYGTEFSSAIAKDNFMGVQFHPEKSSAAGEQLLTNFIKNF